MNVHDLELRLIRLLQDSPRASYAQIARELGVSESTARRRVESLIESKIVTPAMILDISKLGYTTSAFIGLGVDLALMDAVAERLAGFPEVTLVAETTGRYDLIIFVVAPSLDGLTRFVRGHLASIEGVQDTETFVTPRVHKMLRDWRLPVEGIPPEESEN